MNEVVGEKNLPDKYMGKKRLVHHFTRHEIWKCIRCILSEANYGIKGNQLWGTTDKYVNKKGQTKLNIYVCGN